MVKTLAGVTASAGESMSFVFITKGATMHQHDKNNDGSLSEHNAVLSNPVVASIRINAFTIRVRQIQLRVQRMLSLNDDVGKQERQAMADELIDAINNALQGTGMDYESVFPKGQSLRQAFEEKPLSKIDELITRFWEKANNFLKQHYRVNAS